jgi:trigger factor|tara:strand:+ start:861 stop:2150 length:1290 start_codon:yes stop_codon:yes gene_type:complete
LKTKIKNKNSFTKELSVTIPWSDLEKDYKAAFERAKDNYTPPGGRKGKVFGVQLKLFKKNYTPSIEAQFSENSVNQYYRQAIEELKLSPINQGQITHLAFNEGKDLVFKIEFECKPEIKLPNYKKKFKVTAIKYAPSKKDLEDSLSDLQNRFSSMKEITTGADKEHFLFVDLQELESGAPVIGKKIEKQYVRLGFGAFKGDALKTMKGIQKGEKRNVTIDIEGKKVDYEVLVHKVEEQTIPKLDDKFASTVEPELKTLKELKDKINNNISQSFENEHKKAVNNAIIDYFVGKTKFDAPESMIQNYLDHVIENNKAQQPSMTEEQEKEMRDSGLEGAIFNVKWYLIKEQIVNSEKISVSKEDLEERTNELIKKEPQNEKSIKDFLQSPENQQRFFDDMLSEKLFQFLSEFATIKVDKKKSDELRKAQGGS